MSLRRRAREFAFLTPVERRRHPVGTLRIGRPVTRTPGHPLRRDPDSPGHHRDPEVDRHRRKRTESRETCPPGQGPPKTAAAPAFREHLRIPPSVRCRRPDPPTTDRLGYTDPPRPPWLTVGRNPDTEEGPAPLRRAFPVRRGRLLGKMRNLAGAAFLSCPFAKSYELAPAQVRARDGRRAGPAASGRRAASHWPRREPSVSWSCSRPDTHTPTESSRARRVAARPARP